MPPWSGHGRPIRLALVSVPTAAHHGGNADSQAARPGKKSDGLPWTFHGNGIKINFGRSADSRGVGEDVAAPSSTNSMCAGPRCPPPSLLGTRAEDPTSGLSGPASRQRGLPAAEVSMGWPRRRGRPTLPGQRVFLSLRKRATRHHGVRGSRDRSSGRTGIWRGGLGLPEPDRPE